MASLLIERSFRRSGNLAPRSSAALAVLKGGRRRGVDGHRRRERALQPPPVPGKKSTPGKFYPWQQLMVRSKGLLSDWRHFLQGA